ncbi:MAG: glycosyltransferase family 1 protein [Silvanigrellales bacterium]|nr:glycosyltransferase family 1 protein [Silvanigrellales bacterium]
MIATHEVLAENRAVASAENVSQNLMFPYSGALPSLTREASRPFPDVVCLSHLRWSFVYQRPQHLLSRCLSGGGRVFFFEEPRFEPAAGGVPCEPRLTLVEDDTGVIVCTPVFFQCPDGAPADAVSSEIAELKVRALLDELLVQEGIERYILWYYTPMALGFTQHLEPEVVVYDCMDELSAFRFAPPLLKERERALFRMADLVFTGGLSLYDAKKDHHDSVFPFPSSVDVSHFGKARLPLTVPSDQAGIPGPRVGFCGVIDERMDLELLAKVASARPHWSLILVGPVVKIDPATLPKASNIHFLGSKTYAQLPSYLASWDVAMMPFAQNESTRFISPTKTPEYLAAGKPVVSTPIQDVVRTYGTRELVRIAHTAEEFVAHVESALTREGRSVEWLRRVDVCLGENSWDLTWKRMAALIEKAVRLKATASAPSKQTVNAPLLS